MAIAAIYIPNKRYWNWFLRGFCDTFIFFPSSSLVRLTRTASSRGSHVTSRQLAVTCFSIEQAWYCALVATGLVHEAASSRITYIFVWLQGKVASYNERWDPPSCPYESYLGDHNDGHSRRYSRTVLSFSFRLDGVRSRTVSKTTDFELRRCLAHPVHTHTHQR